jgi:hypothetical protein
MKIMRGWLDREGFIRLELEGSELADLITGSVVGEVEADGTRITVLASLDHLRQDHHLEALTHELAHLITAIGTQEGPGPASVPHPEDQEDHAAS